jgi:hypothetical protein
MAKVYLAHDLKHDRNVGLKVLRPEPPLGAGSGCDDGLGHTTDPNSTQLMVTQTN